LATIRPPRDDGVMRWPTMAVMITRDAGSECKDIGETRPKLAIARPSDPDRPIKLGRK
jgi:hypothetical protein